MLDPTQYPVVHPYLLIPLSNTINYILLFAFCFVNNYINILILYFFYIAFIHCSYLFIFIYLYTFSNNFFQHFLPYCITILLRKPLLREGIHSIIITKTLYKFPVYNKVSSSIIFPLYLFVFS